MHIYIGEPVVNQSERICLAKVCEVLESIGGWSYVFANFHAAGRQLDVVVLTENTTLIIEAKGYSLPIDGDLNGQWTQRGPYGKKTIGNAYNQAWEGKNAFRDEMQKITQISGYPDAAVVVAPEIPLGSNLTSGDFKVSVGGIELIPEMLSKKSGASFSQSQCEALSISLCLEPVMSKSAAINEEVIKAERLYTEYCHAFKNYYEPIAKKYCADVYECDSEEITVSDIESFAKRNDIGVLVRGPSGCGKTLLLSSCAISFLNDGGIPMFISAKDFQGVLRELLDKEVSLLLNGHLAIGILKIAKTLGKQVIVFLDGYNECSEVYRDKLTRSLMMFSRRVNAGIYVSTQCEINRPELLKIKTVLVRRPSDELKSILAGIKPDEKVPSNIHGLLAAANSGLEASIVGEVGRFIRIGASRFILFITYTRERLKPFPAEGVRILSAFADAMLKRSSFSISIREFDRLCDEANVTQACHQKLFQSQIVLERGDRVSFCHELYFASLAAEAVIRNSGGDPVRICSDLSSPRFFSSKAFILGAIEDELLLKEVLKECHDHNLIDAAISGECGTVAQSIVNHQIEKKIVAMNLEAQVVRFQVERVGIFGVVVDGSSLEPDLVHFNSYLSGIGRNLFCGKYIRDVLTACRYLDDEIYNISKSYAIEPKKINFEVRDAAFSAAYVFSPKAAISKLISSIHGGVYSIRLKDNQEPEFDLAVLEAWANADTYGQYYFLLGITKYTSCVEVFAPYIAQLMQNLRLFPYHLQLDLIDFSGRLRYAEEPYRTQIIDALTAAMDKLGVMMNSIIFEALGGLGVLEEDSNDYIPVVQKEIDGVLSAENINSDEMAWGLFVCQFDHPYELAYWEVIQGLDDQKKKLLFTKACRGANASDSFFLGTLIRQLSDYKDIDVAPAIARWTMLPEKDGFLPQNAIEAFVEAHQALGRLGGILPQSRGYAENASDRALLACGELFYWASRSDVDDPQIAECTLFARSVLLDHSQCVSAGALKLTTSISLSQDGPPKSLIQHYPGMVLEICREAISRLEDQIPFFPHGITDDRASITDFSIQVLSTLGGEDDLLLLRTLSDHERHGIRALEAIKNIEARMHT